MAAMAAILDFRWIKFLLFLIYKSPQFLLPSFESTGLSVHQKKRKIDFQASFDLQVIPMHPSKFEVNWLSVQEKKRKIDFQDGCHGGHLGFLIGTILAIFDL